MSTITISSDLVSFLPFAPNSEQETVLKRMQDFLDPSCKERFFILKGAAGTGKTSLIKAVTEYLDQQERIFYLSAPTGRAAQIIGKKTGQPASTTHSLVYVAEPDEDGIVVTLRPKTNKEQAACVFIIDEASLINDSFYRCNDSFIVEQPLLSRLIDYANEGNIKSKFLFIGDEYQLPPVGENYSPALNETYLSQKFALPGISASLQQVMRQDEGSYILSNACKLRSNIQRGTQPGALRFNHTGSYGAAIRRFAQYYEPLHDGRSVFIGRSNKQVQAMNLAVRRQLFGWNVRELLLPGELLVANQNMILSDEVLFRGSPVWIQQCGPLEVFAGVHFINTTLTFASLTGQMITARSKVVLDTLVNETGQLTVEKRKAIVHEAMKRNRKYRESKRPEHDAFVGALHARYGYALTCHKAQGGEWQHVFLNPMYGQAEGRWLYTAVTRASDHLYSW